MNMQQPGDITSLRQKIRELIEDNKSTEAFALLGQLWRQQPNSAVASYVLSIFEKIKQELSPVSFRIFILRSFTIEPIVLLARAGAAIAGIDLDVRVGDFNAYAQEILDPNSNLYGFEPNAVILSVQTYDIAPELWHNFADLSPKDIDSIVERIIGDFANWINTFRERSQAHLIIHSLEKPAETAHGLVDTQIHKGQGATIERINRELLRVMSDHTGVYLLDYDSLIARHGRFAWFDKQKWLTMRMPITADCLIHLANEWLKFIHPFSGKICKALVCDLDNTLWGGIIGEDGIDGIKLDNEHLGAAYRNLQRVILDFYRRGIILAICSKNNRDDAMEVLARHPHMLLRPEHFASIQINWNDKAQNMRNIAKELNIGIDSLAFIDDNPVERELVCRQLPRVTVIDLPEDPFQYAQTLRNCPVFERLKLSEEDRERGKMYAQQRQRAELQQNLGSLEDFYYSLEMKMEIDLVSPATLSRVAQLTQRTNQFNLTTRRYTEQEISEIADGPGNHVYTVRVTDRFGDNGIVGVVITQEKDDAWEIDTFLMSCRVIGRTVETAMLATVAEHARTGGDRRLIGWFLPTKKNAPSQEFYAQHGFSCIQETAEGTCWELALSGERPESPPWIDRVINPSVAKNISIFRV